MGLGSGKGLGGGKKGLGRTRRAPKPDRAEINPRGVVVVHDRAYMAHLHQQRRPPIDLNLPDVPASGVMDLHHGPNPSGAQRHDNDAAVVTLDHYQHMEIERNMALERQFRLPFGLWAAFNYWCYRQDIDPENPDAGQRFLDWTLRRLITEAP